MEKEKRYIIMHGFSRDEVLKILKLMRENFPEKELIFATTTPINITWKLEDLINEIDKEHETMKKLKHKNKNR
ncbi:DUF3783 domain-containing protein [Thermosipho ferrireducens]|uniref:DUF3783 domain-containing protein n=1 Tax=Thermosipho ferrireducens TaxID=2571116 RepID=A0ABX7S9S1_9BACT|nr:DUF3783 domain-containing protein [Thermosipho ferrireducens]QTA38133.1 DUF3783 domain-containing protein [Thermosipho ferrireducens]